MTTGPLVVAHRGSSHAAPEHTLAAYEQAILDGADALECDLRLTSDGHLVCVHDRKVDRTSNGSGAVSALELADLADLDFGSWHERAEAPDRDRTGVLTFERLLELTLDAGRRVELHVETKHPTRWAGLVELTLVETLRRHGLADPASPATSQVTVMSFSPIGLRRVRLLAPKLPTVLLLRQVTPARRDGSLPATVGVAGPGIHVLRAHPAYVGKVHARGHRVHVWPVEADEDIDLAIDLGVDGIITNRPIEVLHRLGRA